MSGFRAYRALVYWAWVRELKRKDTLIAMGMVSIITLFIFSMAIPPSPEILTDTRGGILWVTFLLAGTIGIDRAFRGDGEGPLLEGLLASPVGRATIYYARLTATLIFVLATEAVTLALFLVLFDQALTGRGLAVVTAVAVGATLGFLALGTVLSAMTWSLRGGDAILRILLFPMVIPVLGAAVRLTNGAFAGKPLDVPSLAVIAAFDLVFLGAGQLLFEQVVRNVEPAP